MQMNQYEAVNIFESNRQFVAIDLMIDKWRTRSRLAIGERYLRLGSTNRPAPHPDIPVGVVVVLRRTLPFRKALLLRQNIVAPNMLAQ